RYGAPQGVSALERVATAVAVPVIAIGGITPERVAEVRAAGARGVAVISAILSADSPAAATQRFLTALNRSGQRVGLQSIGETDATPRTQTSPPSVRGEHAALAPMLFSWRRSRAR